jgi:hypothetical protein
MFINGKNGYFIRCTFMNALNVDYSPDFFISVLVDTVESGPQRAPVKLASMCRVLGLQVNTILPVRQQQVAGLQVEPIVEKVPVHFCHCCPPASGSNERTRNT